jgi:hypothetical protein
VCLTGGNHRSHEHCAGFSFQLDVDCGYVFVGGEVEDYVAGDEVEVGVEGRWVVELDSDGHDCSLRVW